MVNKFVWFKKQFAMFVCIFEAENHIFSTFIGLILPLLYKSTLHLNDRSFHERMTTMWDFGGKKY